MEIAWLGHSCFRLKGKGATLVTDPYDPTLGYKLGKVSANIVTVSHQHPGHSFVQGIDGNPRVVHRPGEYEIAEVLIEGIATFHDAQHGEKLGKNTVYILEIDDLTVCHLGDLGHALSTEQVASIGDPQVLMVPVGGMSTIDAQAAAEIVRRLEPRVVIPMHYKTDFLKAELDPVAKFLKQMGIAQAASQPKLSITRSSLPADTHVVLLDCVGQG